jgi:hypothetical protein
MLPNAIDEQYYICAGSGIKYIFIGFLMLKGEVGNAIGPNPGGAGAQP